MIKSLNYKGILAKLNESCFVFNITGSKRFGNDTSQSDTDLFVKNSPEVIMFLKDLGFKDMFGVNEYGFDKLDNNCVSVLGIDCPIDGEIHIQISKDFELREKANEIATLIPWQRIPKGDRCKIWNKIFEYLS